MKAALVVSYGLGPQGTPTWLLFEVTDDVVRLVDVVSAASGAEVVEGLSGYDVCLVSEGADVTASTVAWDTVGQTVSTETVSDVSMWGMLAACTGIETYSSTWTPAEAVGSVLTFGG